MLPKIVRLLLIVQKTKKWHWLEKNQTVRKSNVKLELVVRYICA